MKQYSKFYYLGFNDGFLRLPLRSKRGCQWGNKEWNDFIMGHMEGTIKRKKLDH